jgi:hypothetical protein
MWDNGIYNVAHVGQWEYNLTQRMIGVKFSYLGIHVNMVDSTVAG